MYPTHHAATMPSRTPATAKAWRRRLLVTALASTLPSVTLAQGFYVDEQSVRHLGNAFTGIAAISDDASAVYYNPAAMSGIDQARLSVNATAVYTGLDFKGDALMVSNSGGGSVIPVQGSAVNVDETSPLPTFYLNLPIKDGLVYGFGLNAPFNTGTDLGDDSVARYQTVESTINTITMTNAFSYEVNSQLSVGFGVVAQRADATLEQALNPSLVCLDGSAGTAACNLFGVTVDGTDDYDGSVSMEGDELSVGYNLGLLFRFNDHQQLGLSYRSRIEHKIQGTVTAVVPVTQDKVSGPAYTRITTPEIASLSYSHGFGDWTLLLDATWTGWSEFDQLTFTSSDPDVQAFLAPQTYDWDDSLRLGIGLEYAVNQALTLRTGFALDNSPIPSEHATIDLGQGDYHQYGIGLSYQPSADLLIDAGYMLGVVDDGELSQGDLTDPDQNLAQLNGRSEYSFHSLGLGARWSF